MYSSKKRKIAVKSIQCISGNKSIAYILPFAGRFCRSGDLFAFVVALRELNRKYGNISVNGIVCLFCLESIEDKQGFFWKKSITEIDDKNGMCFRSLLRLGFFERVPYPLTYSHILPPNVKLHKLSPIGRDALLFFRKEVKKLTKGKAKSRISLSERLL